METLTEMKALNGTIRTESKVFFGWDCSIMSREQAEETCDQIAKDHPLLAKKARKSIVDVVYSYMFQLQPSRYGVDGYIIVHANEVYRVKSTGQKLEDWRKQNGF